MKNYFLRSEEIIFLQFFLISFRFPIRIQLVNTINIRIINNDNFLMHTDRSIEFFLLTWEKLGQNNRKEYRFSSRKRFLSFLKKYQILNNHLLLMGLNLKRRKRYKYSISSRFSRMSIIERDIVSIVAWWWSNQTEHTVDLEKEIRK